MQITVKVNPGSGKSAASVVRRRLKEAHPSIAQAADVEEVFPGLESGRRAGMVTVKLPQKVSENDAKAVLRALKRDDDIEYAEQAAPRRNKR